MRASKKMKQIPQSKRYLGSVASGRRRSSAAVARPSELNGARRSYDLVVIISNRPRVRAVGPHGLGFRVSKLGFRVFPFPRNPHPARPTRARARARAHLLRLDVKLLTVDLRAELAIQSQGIVGHLGIPGDLAFRA